MKRAAFFVEGLTEAIFLQRLLEEIIGKRHLVFRFAEQKFGRVVFAAPSTVELATYEILIVNCCNDDQVKSRIIEERERLIVAGYSLIVGIRDVYPADATAIPYLRRFLHHRLPTSGIKIEMILAVMEIEAWFISEHTHFQRISPTLTTEAIQASVGFDIQLIDVETIACPADTLHLIYSVAGMAYHKTRSHFQRTVDELDIAEIYWNKSSSVPALGHLVSVIDGFI